MSLHPQRIALIGGTGFVGQHLAECLVRRQRQLTLLTRRRERSKALGIIARARGMSQVARDAGVTLD